MKIIVAAAADRPAAHRRRRRRADTTTGRSDTKYQAPTGRSSGGPGLSPWCARNMLACGFTYDPGTGTWHPRGADSTGTTSPSSASE
jgi:hypothetical protein